MNATTLHFLLLALPAAAFAGGKAPLPPPPTQPVNPLSFWDGRIVLSLENQTRFEYRDNNFDFDRGVKHPTDDSWLLTRTRPGILLKPSPFFKIFIQGQDSREIDSDRPNEPGNLGAEGDDPLDFFQLYAEVGDPKSNPWGLKVGRQTMDYGDQRLIGSLQWSNLARSFDAVKVSYTAGESWVDAFAASPVIVDSDGLNESDLDTVLYGVYGHTPVGGQIVEPYFLYLNDDLTSREVFTVGTHVKSTPGAHGPWDYEGELAYQFGDIAGKDLNAFAGFVRGGYTFARAAWKPRAGMEYSFATGDRDSGDGSINTFQNLYPTNHPIYGYMDLFSWQNLHDLRFTFSVKPIKDLTASIDWHSFWLASTDDAWRRANAKTAVRPTGEKASSASNYAGSELDILLTWKAADFLNVVAGYSHFFAGSYLSDNGADSDADFVYVMTQIKF